MRTLNTTSGPVEYDPPRSGHINTSAVVEEDLVYLDEEPEIIAVVPGGDWCALIGGEAVPVVVFVALDTGRMHGVEVGADGLIDLNADVEKRPNFSGYTQTTNR
jgi:hypothetical protein